MDSLAAKKIYEGGTAIDSKFGTTLGLSGSKIQLKNADSTVISEVTLPAATHTHAGGGLTKGTALVVDYQVVDYLKELHLVVDYQVVDYLKELHLVVDYQVVH